MGVAVVMTNDQICQLFAYFLYLTCSVFSYSLQCCQHHLASPAGWEADSDAGGCPSCVLDCELPDWQTTVRLQVSVSDSAVSNTGALQRTVLSFPSSSPSTLQILTTAQSPAIFSGFLMTLL